MIFGENTQTSSEAKWILDESLEPEIDREEEKFRLLCQLKTFKHQVQSQAKYSYQLDKKRFIEVVTACLDEGRRWIVHPEAESLFLSTFQGYARCFSEEEITCERFSAMAKICFRRTIIDYDIEKYK